LVGLIVPERRQARLDQEALSVGKDDRVDALGSVDRLQPNLAGVGLHGGRRGRLVEAALIRRGRELVDSVVLADDLEPEHTDDHCGGRSRGACEPHLDPAAPMGHDAGQLERRWVRLADVGGDSGPKRFRRGGARERQQRGRLAVLGHFVATAWAADQVGVDDRRLLRVDSVERVRTEELLDVGVCQL
jgi:hypothetical protein